MTDLGLFAPAEEDVPMEIDEKQQENAQEETREQAAFVSTSDLSCAEIYEFLVNSESVLTDFAWKLSDFDPSDEKHVACFAALYRRMDLFYDAKFTEMLPTVLETILAQSGNTRKKIALLDFLVHCFHAIEHTPVRQELLRLVNIGTWNCLVDEDARNRLLEQDPDRQRLWDRTLKKYQSASKPARKQLEFERSFFSNLIQSFYDEIEQLEITNTVSLSYCEKVLELLLDVLSQLPTRRYLVAVFEDHLLLPRCFATAFYTKHKDEPLVFNRLLKLVQFFMTFEVDNITGLPLDKDELSKQRREDIAALQRTCFIKYPKELEEFVFASAGKLERPANIKEIFGKLSDGVLVSFCQLAGIRTGKMSTSGAFSRHFLIEAIVWKLQIKSSALDSVISQTLYPTQVYSVIQDLLFNDTILPHGNPAVRFPSLPLPKLNLQYLTFKDYFSRNMTLYKCGSAYELRRDIEDAVLRLAPRYNVDSETQFDRTIFTGWSRNAVALMQMQVEQIGHPHLTSVTPSYVTADLSYSLVKYGQNIKDEWDDIRPKDIVYIVSLQAEPDISGNTTVPKTAKEFVQKFGITDIRGAQVHQLLGDNGDTVKDFVSAKVINKDGYARIESDLRCIRVLLDPNQHMLDIAGKKEHDFYGRFNVLLRRNRVTGNSFKYIVESIRDLIQNEVLAPEWMQELFLGYGARDSAHYTNMPDQLKMIDFLDTFQDVDHLKESFPDRVDVLTQDFDFADSEDQLNLPFVLTFPESDYTKLEDDETEIGEKRSATETRITVQTGAPYANLVPNTVRFTARQVEAIRSCMSRGLTVVSCHPGAGEFEVVSQTLLGLYFNHPGQNNLVVCETEFELDRLCTMLEQRLSDTKHILRLGRELDFVDMPSASRWGKSGRIEAFLASRDELLGRTRALAASLSIAETYGENCTNASYFFSHIIKPKWDEYHKKYIKKRPKLDTVISGFPFSKYFDAQQAFANKTLEDVIETATACFASLEAMFKQIEDVRAFELLRDDNDRANYIIVKEARIVAMTCRHAAIQRRELVRLGFKYNSVIVMQAGRMPEIEAVIPMLLQSPVIKQAEDGDERLLDSRLDRVIVVGDPEQPPRRFGSRVLSAYSSVEQSLVTRLTRLGVPSIQLDSASGYRPSIVELFKWKYPSIHHVNQDLSGERNAGFVYNYQFVDVADYEGHGETEPREGFFQNLGEAEYVVGVYQYMRLVGYPADKIAILTTCNGQKALIRDVLDKRCSWHEFFGTPRVELVSDYQHTTSEYALVSLVRTGRDDEMNERVLASLLSRATHGLYVFGRWSLYSAMECFEAVKPLFEANSNKLAIHQKEQYASAMATPDKKNRKAGKQTTVGNLMELGKIVYEKSIHLAQES